MKQVALFIFGLLGSFLANLLGGWDMFLQVLIGVMAADFITGLVVAGVFKKSNKTETGALSSRAGWQGLCKKGMTLVIVYVGAMVDKVSGTEIVRNAIIIGYIANDALSIVENAGLMGMWVPKFLKDAIEILKKKSEGGTDE
jgi:toxin secretion/phage lysis holin